MAIAVAAAVMGAAQRNRRAGVQAWRTWTAGAVRSIAATTAMHRAQLDACASTAVAACAFSVPSAQAASVSASRHAPGDAADEPRSVLPSQSLRSGSWPIESLFILNDPVNISCSTVAYGVSPIVPRGSVPDSSHQRPLSHTRNTAQSARRSIHDPGEMLQRLPGCARASARAVATSLPRALSTAFPV
jgi:hypothetical protein